jgi:hypothetical protein
MIEETDRGGNMALPSVIKLPVIADTAKIEQQAETVARFCRSLGLLLGDLANLVEATTAELQEIREN